MSSKGSKSAKKTKKHSLPPVQEPPSQSGGGAGEGSPGNPEHAPGSPSSSDPERDRARADVVGTSENIEREFSERAFREKMSKVARELEETRNGTSEKLQRQLRLLEQQKADRIRRAEQWKTFQHQSAVLICRAERLSASQEFDAAKEGIVETLLSTLEEKQKRLQEEKLSLTLSEGGNPPRLLRRRGRSEKEKDRDPAAARRRLQPTHINHVLSDIEILEDLQLIQKKGIKHRRML